MYFFLQTSSPQRDSAHMQLLHEAVDTTKCWEKSPPSPPLHYTSITIPVRTFPISGQCEQLFWSRR